MLKLGYKASAEQFRPGSSSISPSRRSGRLRLDRGQRSLPALAPHRRPRAVLVRLAGGARRADHARHARHQRRDADVPLPPGDRRAGDGHARQPRIPGACFLGVGTGESLNEVPATGIEWPPFKERFGRLREAIELMRQLWSEERVTFEGEYYRTERATIYDRPEVPVPLYVAASGAVAARLAGRVGDGFICTSGKAPELYTETLLPAVAEGLEQGRPRRRQHREDDRDEGVVRPRPAARAGGHPALGGAGAVAGGEDRRRGPAGDGAARRRAADRAGRQPLDRVRRPRRARRADQAEPSTSASRTWSSTPRARTSGASSICTPSRSCRVCGRVTAPQAEARQPRPAQAAADAAPAAKSARSRTGGTFSWSLLRWPAGRAPLRAAAQEDRIRETAGHSHDCFRLSPSLLSAEAAAVRRHKTRMSCAALFR